jgi:hypothetical protein
VQQRLVAFVIIVRWQMILADVRRMKIYERA